MTDRPAVTRMLRAWQAGERQALDELTPLVYGELRRIAHRLFRGEREGHTLQPTAVVNEAFANLLQADLEFSDRAHFFSLAARMMRRVLVDHARARNAGKRGAGERNETLVEDLVGAARLADEDVLAVDQALSELAEFDDRKAQVLEMHVFGGLSYAEMGDVLGVAPATLNRDLRAARAWLKARLGDR
jgi:RNA polymerase sigma factor (TIGR02999 family)